MTEPADPVDLMNRARDAVAVAIWAFRYVEPAFVQAVDYVRASDLPGLPHIVAMTLAQHCPTEHRADVITLLRAVLRFHDPARYPDPRSAIEMACFKLVRVTREALGDDDAALLDESMQTHLAAYAGWP